jgi:hypothetical protein
MLWQGDAAASPGVIGNQEIEPAGKNREAGQQVRPQKQNSELNYNGNNKGIIPHALSPASHQFWVQGLNTLIGCIFAGSHCFSTAGNQARQLIIS